MCRQLAFMTVEKKTAQDQFQQPIANHFYYYFFFFRWDAFFVFDR